MNIRISSLTILPAVLLFLVFSCGKEYEKPPDPVTDIEGNTYKTVKTGDQIWIAENLKTTRYNDGTDIPLVTGIEDWRNLTSPGYCWYNNEEVTYKDTYGALYNSYTISTGKLCPSGWHVPSREEWQQLIEFSGDTITAGGKLKEAGTNHWLAPNYGAGNNIGFMALPAGIRYFEGSFSAVSSFTAIWSSSESGSNNAWFLSLYFGDAAANMSYRSKKHGFSVRCIKDS